MSKSQYSEVERAMIYGSWLVTSDSTATAELYRTLLGWSLSRTTVDRIVEKFKFVDNFNNYPGQVRSQLVGNVECDMLIESLGFNHNTLDQAAVDIKMETGKIINKRTLDNYTEDLGLIYSKPTIKLNHTPEDLDKRYDYANLFPGYPAESLIWEDESFFPLEWDCTSKQWMLSKDRAEITQINCRGGLHVLGAISLRGSSELYILEKGLTWNSATYIEALSTVVLPFLTQYHKARTTRFIHDNARCHSSEETTAWLEKNEIKTFAHPPRSPDLNPIELIWGLLKRRVYRNKNFKSLEALRHKIMGEWKSLGQEIINNCIYEVLYNRLLNVEYVGV